MIDPGQFRHLVIGPALTRLAACTVAPPWSRAAETLLLGTALQESSLTYLIQLGDTSGRGGHGLYQDEPEDLDDLKVNFLGFRPVLAGAVNQFRRGGDDVRQLEFDMEWATIIARLHYFRSPQALPPEDAEAMAAFYKSDYNTILGAAEPAQVLENFHRAMATL
jgi:hypothetical protein